MKRKFKKWWPTTPTVSTKQRIASFWTQNEKKTMTYDVGNPVPDLGQAHKCTWDKIETSILFYYCLLPKELFFV
jgi:hypothetical protein